MRQPSPSHRLQSPCTSGLRFDRSWSRLLRLARRHTPCTYSILREVRIRTAQKKDQEANQSVREPLADHDDADARHHWRRRLARSWRSGPQTHQLSLANLRQRSSLPQDRWQSGLNVGGLLVSWRSKESTEELLTVLTLPCLPTVDRFDRLWYSSMLKSKEQT